ncbi:MAG: Rossmann-like domain protein [Pelotomaculum sp. PtaU1.Bin065]|nr:MAG: Rossmann-like domain protein [Pelotomaculum sp. PtaU1.Bin065]
MCVVFFWLFRLKEMIPFNKPSIAVVGAGKVGSALALLLSRRGYLVTGVADESFSAAERLAGQLKVPATGKPEEITSGADIVFITTPDRIIAPVAEEISKKKGFKAGQVVFHTSGAHPAGAVGAVRRSGALAASLHPLQSFADVKMAMENLEGSYFALEGDAGALLVAEQIVRDLGGRSFTIAAKDKPLYHAAACIASNYLVSLMHLATGLFSRFGLSREEAFQALLPLVQGTVSNIAQVSPAPALTGPIARGDGTTLEGHLATLREVGKQEMDLYCVLGLYTIKVALEKGSINQDQEERLKEIFKEAYVK